MNDNLAGTYLKSLKTVIAQKPPLKPPTPPPRPPIRPQEIPVRKAAPPAPIVPLREPPEPPPHKK